ncbi:hypothetical protein THAOC_08306, partial [Thalassiosira oceanica]
EFEPPEAPDGLCDFVAETGAPPPAPRAPSSTDKVPISSNFPIRTRHGGGKGYPTGPQETQKGVSRVTQPHVSKTRVAGRPHLGVPGKITGSVGSADLPYIITAVGPYKTAQHCGVSPQGSFWAGQQWTLPCSRSTLGVPSTGEYAEKLVVEAFEEDSGLKVGSGVAGDHEKEGGPGPGWGLGSREGETETEDDEGKAGKAAED